MKMKSNFKLNFFLIAIISALALLSACSSNKIRADLTAEERMQVAMKMFDKHDYLDAKTQFNIITLSHSGTAFADKAQYYLAECHFHLKEYILAANEYQRLLKIFPNSEFVDDAKYKLGLSYYELSPKYSLDQEYTNKAIQQFQEFLEDYPSSSLAPDVTKILRESRGKLAHKLFSSAELYRRMSVYDAAIIYYNKVLERYYDTPYAAKAQYWVGECNLHLDQYSEALDAFQIYLAKYPDDEYVARAKERIKTAQKRLSASSASNEKLSEKSNP